MESHLGFGLKLAYVLPSGNQTFHCGCAPQESLMTLKTPLGQIFLDNPSYFPLFVSNFIYGCVFFVLVCLCVGLFVCLCAFVSMCLCVGVFLCWCLLGFVCLCVIVILCFCASVFFVFVCYCFCAPPEEKASKGLNV